MICEAPFPKMPISYRFDGAIVVVAIEIISIPFIDSIRAQLMTFLARDKITHGLEESNANELVKPCRF